MDTLNSTVRVNVSLPVRLVRKLKRVAPTRGMSAFLAEAATEKIKQLEKRTALKELANAPASFANIDDAAYYITTIRERDRERDKRLGL